MIMEPKVNYAVVGAFVILLTAAITLAIIWLSSGFSLQANAEYLVYMTESVSGLSLDSPVEYNGVNVGNVKSIRLNRKNPQLVEVLLNIDRTTPITRGTVATLNTRGITGFTYLALKDKSTDLRPLLPEPGEKYAVIPTAPSLFVRLDTALTQLTANLRKITETIQSLFDRQNQESFKHILLNIKKVTGTFAENSQQLNAIFANTAKASKQLSPFLQSSIGAVNDFHYQTLPATYKVMTSLDEMTRNLVEVSLELKQNPSILIRGVQPQPLGPGETK